MGFAYQTIIYIAWGIVFGVVGLIIAGLILQLICAILKGIVDCLFCNCSNNEENPPEQNEENILPDNVNA